MLSFIFIYFRFRLFENRFLGFMFVISKPTVFAFSFRYLSYFPILAICNNWKLIKLNLIFSTGDEFNCRFERRKFQLIFKTCGRRRLGSVAAGASAERRRLRSVAARPMPASAGHRKSAEKN